MPGHVSKKICTVNSRGTISIVITSLRKYVYTIRYHVKEYVSYFDINSDILLNYITEFTLLICSDFSTLSLEDYK